MKIQRTPEGVLNITLGPVPAVLVVYELEANEPRAFYPEDPGERADLARWLLSTEWGRELGEAMASTVEDQ